ncbi:disulfide oxidoreductase [Aquibacillus kalidii]|uniref:disulfide oxidoreductase n=1 Tax=Aquibacillus kalidii TaxID=2762597 RepID=UPI00164414DA|nr:disulfide oxidoreductase [Aquibacillus kalidii]
MPNKNLLFAWIISIIATLGSLYFSEVKQFIPCELCWFQRIFMYPLPIILGIAYYRQNKEVAYYILPLSIIGAAISSYHYMLQKIPYMRQFETCTDGVPCSGAYINWFGFITIPFLALTAFILIAITQIVILIKR